MRCYQLARPVFESPQTVVDGWGHEAVRVARVRALAESQLPAGTGSTSELHRTWTCQCQMLCLAKPGWWKTPSGTSIIDMRSDTQYAKEGFATHA